MSKLHSRGLIRPPKYLKKNPKTVSLGKNEMYNSKMG
jgi:hypothetical protein